MHIHIHWTIDVSLGWGGGVLTHSYSITEPLKTHIAPSKNAPTDPHTYQTKIYKTLTAPSKKQQQQKSTYTFRHSYHY